MLYKNNWKIFNQNEHKFLNAQKDKKGYVIRDAENIVFHGRKINAGYFIPKDGDIFFNDNYAFYSMKKNIFFVPLKKNQGILEDDIRIYFEDEVLLEKVKSIII